MSIIIVTVTFIIVVIIRGSNHYATCMPLPSDTFHQHILVKGCLLGVVSLPRRIKFWSLVEGQHCAIMSCHCGRSISIRPGV